MPLYRQLVQFTPPYDENLDGKCLRGCRRGFGAPGYGTTDTAADSWARAIYKHTLPFPAGADVLVHLALSNEPAGHIVVLKADGRVYSTGFNSTWTIFTDWAAFKRAWPAKWGSVYLLGWAEDINGVRVAKPSTNPAGSILKPLIDRVAALTLTKRKKTPVTWLMSKDTKDCFRFFETTFDRRMPKTGEKAKNITRALGFGTRSVASSVILAELARLNERRAMRGLEPLTLD